MYEIKYLNMYQDPAQNITSAIISGRYYWPSRVCGQIIILSDALSQLKLIKEDRAINEATLKINSLPILFSFHTIYLGYSEIFYLISSTQLDIQWWFKCILNKRGEICFWNCNTQTVLVFRLVRRFAKRCFVNVKEISTAKKKIIYIHRQNRECFYVELEL